MDIIGYALLFLGLGFIYIGVVGVFRFHHFYARILSAADVDTVGLITMLLGVCFLGEDIWFSLKVGLILLLLLILNPIVTSSIVDSAYYSGYRLQQPEGADDD